MNIAAEAQNTAIEWINLTFSGVAAFFAGLAVLVAWIIYRRQKKIALYEQRMKIYRKIEEYVHSVESWDFNFGWYLKLGLYEGEIETLFDRNFCMYCNELKEKSEQLDMLHGDYQHAQKKGYSFGSNNAKRDEVQIENEIREVVKSIGDSFEKEVRQKYNRYFKI